MQAVLVAVIAVLGTLGGAIVNGLLQMRHAARAEEHASTERLRQDRLSAYLVFAQSLSEFRGAQLERWYARRDYTEDSDQYRQAREETHRTGAVARSSLYRVQLLIDEDELIGLAREVYLLAMSIEKADSEDELNKRAEYSRGKSEAFIVVAGRLGKVRLRSIAGRSRRPLSSWQTKLADGGHHR